MEKWAKLFESNGFQVLFTKEYDDDDNPRLNITTRIEGDEIALCPVFEGEDAEASLDRVFDIASQDTADKFTRLIINCETVEDALIILAKTSS